MEFIVWVILWLALWMVLENTYMYILIIRKEGFRKKKGKHHGK